MFKPNANQNCLALAYLNYAQNLQIAEKAFNKARDNFLKGVPVGGEAEGLRHIRVHNLIPNNSKLKSKGLWRKVAEMQVNIAKLRKATKGWTVHDLRTIAKIVTHHRVLDVVAAAKAAKKGRK